MEHTSTLSDVDKWSKMQNGDSETGNVFMTAILLLMVQGDHMGSCLYHHCVGHGWKCGVSRWNFDPISFQAWVITTSGLREAILLLRVQGGNRRSCLHHHCVGRGWKCGVSRWNFDPISFQSWDITTSGRQGRHFVSKCTTVQQRKLYLSPLCRAWSKMWG